MEFNNELREKMEVKVLKSLKSQNATPVSRELLDSLIDLEISNFLDSLLELVNPTEQAKGE